MQTEQRRVAERVLIEPQLDAVLADTKGRIGEIATLGCRFEHTPRLAIGVTMPLAFKWEGQQISLPVKIVWSELMLSGGDKFYHSGLQFGEGDPAQFKKIQACLGRHVNRVLSALFPDLPLAPRPKPHAVPFMASSPFLSLDSGPKAPASKTPGFLEFRWRNGQWDFQETQALLQPRDGLSFADDIDPDAIEIWRRHFEGADEPKRRMLRAALELLNG